MCVYVCVCVSVCIRILKGNRVGLRSLYICVYALVLPIVIVIAKLNQFKQTLSTNQIKIYKWKEAFSKGN